MSLKEDELKIVSVSELLSEKLVIPDYQRPYRWSAKSVNRLFTDIDSAFKSGTAEYRVGSVILHKDGDRYNIVDGQQRLTTLSILLSVLGETNISLLEAEFVDASHHSILENFQLLERRVNALSPGEKEKFKEDLKTKCTLVKIVTDNEQEAFQFFDSQNSRGKALKPHDLLKSYHLREMTSESEELKVKIISAWEDKKQNHLEALFADYLFPITQWVKRKNGLNYSSQKIQTFKGIKAASNFNYALYHIASNLYIEQVNESENLILHTEINQFQLSEPIVAGRRFFYWTLHYADLLEKVMQKIERFHTKEEIPSAGRGNIYSKQLYESVLLLFADRFGFEKIDDEVMHLLYSWSYSLRLTMYAVYQVSINNYANGKHDRINHGLDMFSRINEMMSPEEMREILLEKPEMPKDGKYSKIYKKLQEWNGS